MPSIKTRLWILILLSILTLAPHLVSAQDAPSQLAATMEVLASGVEVKRTDTANWLNVKKEAIVGVGDAIRTDATGRARITFFADGTDTLLLPNTEYHIDQFEGGTDSFNVTVSVVAGQTTQRLSRLLDAGSSYTVQTPGMILGARGTEFAIRVEDSGRAAMLVSKGDVAASNPQNEADVPPGYGIRAESGSSLSDVVEASTFDQLDAALDGCTATIHIQDDLRFNVRIGPALTFPRVGTIDPAEVDKFVGVNQGGGWYRIEFRSGFGWINSSTATVSRDCVGLRKFPDNYGPEDVTLYTALGDVITSESLTTAAPEATSQPGG